MFLLINCLGAWELGFRLGEQVDIDIQFIKKDKPNDLSPGASNQNRTDDLILTMDALYLLSYEGKYSFGENARRLYYMN